MMDTPNDLIPAEQARLEFLHVSPKKMAAMLKEGTIRHFPNPLDKRQKLVSKAEVLALLPRRAEAA